MRASWIAAVPVLAGLMAMPAQAQVSARLHVDIPIGHGASIGATARRQVIVRDYDRSRFGGWESYYDQWLPVTVYYYDGYYYDYPIVPYAEPVIVYRFRDELFFAPRQREFVTWREQYRAPVYRRDDDRYSQPMPRYDRDDRRYQAPRDYRTERNVQPPRVDRRQSSERQAPAPAARNDRAARPRTRGH